jgi:LmbE family N-acetylglucosaminyl deacetylase
MWPPDETQVGAVMEPRERRGRAEVLGDLLPTQALRGPVLFVAAQPDDALRHATWLLHHSPGCHVVHVTDGAPRDLPPRGDAPSPSREAFARQREQESFAALALAGLSEDQQLSLGAVAEEASRELVTLTECLLALIKALRPSLLVVPPYDGTHPDQDAAAFIAHAAVALLERGGRTAPSLLEMLPPGVAATEPPASGGARPVAHVALSGEELRLKQRMLACVTSREVRSAAGEHEHYRRAPRYDFTRPAREGLVLYGGAVPRMTTVHWRRLARHALEELRLVQTPWH